MGSEIEICTACGKPCTHGFFMCEEVEGQWCSGECFAPIKCEERHGEGCATAVFLDAALDPEPAAASRG